MARTTTTMISLCLSALTWGAALNATAADLPALPKEIKDKGVLKVGVRCDQPPYGFKDAAGNYAGIETEMAWQIGEWAFGSRDKVELTCVTAENRIQQLISKKVDLLYATLGVTPERARVVAFSDAYRWDGSDIVVLKDSPVKNLDELKNKTVIALKGSNQARWFEEKMPSTETLRLNSTADALQALKQKRADGAAFDIALLVSIANNDTSLRRLNDSFLLADAAAGLRKNETEWLAYVNAAQARMKSEGLYRKWANKWAPKGTVEHYASGFEQPRPTEK
jgi:polar amino acid transport system substrate-binding protein